MQVAPIAWPQANINSGADFTQLGKLGDIYKQAQADQRRLAALQSLGSDPNQDAQTLLKSGDLSLAQLGINMRNRTVDQQREDARYAVTDPREDARLRIAQNADQRDNTRLGYEGQRVGLAVNADARAANEDVRAANSDMREAAKLRILQEKAANEGRSLTEVLQERHEAWLSRGLKPEGPQYLEYLTNEKTTGVEAANKASVSPVYGTRQNADGSTERVLMQLNPRGEALETKLPPGVKISPDQKTLDLGDKFAIVDKNTNEVLRYVPKNLAAAAEDKERGDIIAKAKAALPVVDVNEKFLLRNIDETVKHPGKAAALGWKSVFPTVPGSEAHGFEQRLSQVQSRAFLTAYDTLRGAGQISEGEGKAATAALNRAVKAQNVKEFDEAMTEFKEYVTDAANAARRKAAGDFKTGQGKGADDVMARARIAIDQGAPAKVVRQRLIDAGVDPGDIGK